MPHIAGMQTFPRALAAAALSMLAPAAHGLDAGQIAAIDRLAASAPAGKSQSAALASHYAVLLWVEDYCNGRSSEGVRAYLLKKGDTDTSAFEEAWATALDMLGKTEPKAMCALALEQYGPNGQLIKGGWAPKG